MSRLLLLLSDATNSITSGAGTACGSSCNTKGLDVAFTNVANTLTFIVGAASVIMIIIGGLRYVLSNGDSKATTEAKNTILYAVIGLVVAIVAYAIVGYVDGTIGA